MVLKHYNDFVTTNVTLNRNYVSAQQFIKNYKKYKYDSFIFGSSHTLGFYPDDWKQFLKKESSAYTFDGSLENIKGIYDKVNFIKSKNVRVKNGLIVICMCCTFNKGIDKEHHLFMQDYRVSGGSKIKFHFTFLKAFYNNNFLLKYFYSIIGKYFYSIPRQDKRLLQVDPIHNGLILRDIDNYIEKSEHEYYNDAPGWYFPQQNFRILNKKINSTDSLYLEGIKEIFKKDRTIYKIVISPQYNMSKINSDDLLILNQIFDDQVFDFSGNNSITSSKYNYYEKSHYRRKVGKRIMGEIYNNN